MLLGRVCALLLLLGALCREEGHYQAVSSHGDRDETILIGVDLFSPLTSLALRVFAATSTSMNIIVPDPANTHTY